MKLFQYWNDMTPPDEVASWIEGFRVGNPHFDHELYNEESATDFIRKNYGKAELTAFQALGMPAMQADYIRLCVIHTHGGLYCDVDHQLKEPLSTLLDENPGDLMLHWFGIINTALLLFPRAGNPFIKACLDICTENALNRRFSSEFTSTGPGVQNAVAAILDPAHLEALKSSFLCDPNASVPGLTHRPSGGWGFDDLVEIARRYIGSPSQDLLAAFQAISIRNTFYIGRWMGSDQPAYKKSARHWQNWKGPIYR